MYFHTDQLHSTETPITRESSIASCCQSQLHESQSGTPHAG